VALSAENSDGMLGELLATSFRAHGGIRVVIDAGCKTAAMEKIGAQQYLREYYSQRAAQRANHARRISGNKEIRFAEEFQRVSPQIIYKFGIRIN
jgi:hypothetical protein